MGMGNVPALKRRWYRLTPDRFLAALLAVEGLLLLSERFEWFEFNRHKGWTVLVGVATLGVAVLLLFLWFAAGLLFRRRFQFSIRSLLGFVLVCAVVCSWLAVQMQQARRQKEAVEALGHFTGCIFYDYQCSGRRWEPPGHAWLEEVLGEDFFADIEMVSGLNDALTDAEMEHLESLPRLRVLRMSGRGVTDAGLTHLEGLTQLRDLVLVDSHITDAGLVHLETLARLEVLHLRWMPITDAGLVHLKGLKGLRELSLHATRVTPEGVQRLRQALPECDIDCWQPSAAPTGLPDAENYDPFAQQ